MYGHLKTTINISGDYLLYHRLMSQLIMAGGDAVHTDRRRAVPCVNINGRGRNRMLSGCRNARFVTRSSFCSKNACSLSSGSFDAVPLVCETTK